MSLKKFQSKGIEHFQACQIPGFGSSQERAANLHVSGFTRENREGAGLAVGGGGGGGEIWEQPVEVRLEHRVL